MEEKRMTVEEAANKLLPCPYCGCQIGILFIGGGYQWHGVHKIMCPVENNPSGAFGRADMVVEYWNMRSGKKNV